MSNNGIGGYFGLELPLRRSVYYPSAIRYQSARAAFYALLLAGRPKRVWVPRYICDAMLSPLRKAKIDFEFYLINDDLSIKDDIRLNDDEWILYVNYFGICGAHQKKILSKYNSKQIVFDHAQAFFSPPMDCLATIYSPRKFFGVPDGGLLITSLSIEEPIEIDTTSINRVAHLIQRIASTAESGYSAFRKAEASLEEFEPMRLSVLTSTIMSSIDYDEIKKIRTHNFELLHKMLSSINEFKFDTGKIDGPQCYPFFSRNQFLRSILQKNKIFVPIYWPECLKRSLNGSAEHMFVNHLFALPCDQRYNDHHISYMAECVACV